MILYIIATLISVSLGAAIFGYMLKDALTKGVSSSNSADSSLEEELQAIHQQLLQELIDPANYASQAQFESVTENLSKLKEAIAAEQEKLAKIEQELDIAQSEVESREVTIQELKGSKEEEAKYLEQISLEFELLTQEAAGLEENLNNSLSEISRIEGQVEFTREQRKQFDQFSSTVREAVDRLQELSVEGQEVERRLRVLSQQYRNLEDEYTKLVEQQFA